MAFCACTCYPVYITIFHMQPLDFLAKTTQFWFTEVPVPENFVSADPNDDPNATSAAQLKIWMSLTCQVNYP